MKILFFFIVLYTGNICSAQSNIVFYYQDKMKATESDKMAYKFYLENTPKKNLRKDSEVILFFNNAAFMEDRVTINGDVYIFNNYTCGYRQIKINKGCGKIKIASIKKNDMQFNLKQGINYIIIAGDHDNKWSVTFSEFFPTLICF